MIEVRGLRLSLDSAVDEEQCARHMLTAAARSLGVSVAAVEECTMARKAVDARRKDDVHFVLTAHVALSGGAGAEMRVLETSASRDCAAWSPKDFAIADVTRSITEETDRPVVVGAGCAGLFCALVLARAGARPVLIERGDAPLTRQKLIRSFEQSGQLDINSNIQFGCGGAGMFSDGKLSTGTKSAALPWITRTLVEHGAPRAVLFDAKPHIGSDLLPAIVQSILDEIERRGGTVYLRTLCCGLDIRDGALAGVHLASAGPGNVNTPGWLAAKRVVLATGHSARETYRMLKEQGIQLERKTFAMGARIEHLQTMVNQAQYGKAAFHPALGAADYKLSAHMHDGRGVFTFCMCPGGYVVAATSDTDQVVTNGMSEFARNSSNANSALLVNVTPQDLPGDDVLAGLDLQEQCEKSAYDLGGGDYRAPAQRLADFMAGGSLGNGQASRRAGSKRKAGTLRFPAGSPDPTYARGVSWRAFDGALPAYVTDGMRAGITEMARRLRGFDSPDAILTAVESRSSSPVRITRDAASRQSLNTPGLYPCGEGAGYAGGIMSAAADGCASAQTIIAELQAERGVTAAAASGATAISDTPER